MSEPPSNPDFKLTLRIVLPFAAGYFVSYVFRTVNAVISPDLVDAFSLLPADLGLLTSTYFLTFAAFQLPLGILLDRYGPRRVDAFLLLFAAAGAAAFAVADGFGTLVVGRALIGFGVSACLMASFKAFTLWFPAERLPLVNGWVMAAGGMGALAATAPVEVALGVTDWRGVFVVLSVLTMVASALIYLVVPEREQAPPSTTFREQLGGVLEVFRSRYFWQIVPLALLSQASFLAIQGLWSGPWLRDVAGFDRATVASVLFATAGAMVTGHLVLGNMAWRLARRGIPTMWVAGAGMFSLILVQFALALGGGAFAVPLWLAFGFLGAAGILPYAVLSQHFPSRLAGRANTGLNLLVFVGAFGGQWGIGAIIGFWPETGYGGYSPEGYRAAFLTAAVAQALAFGWFVRRVRR